jgi:hypothetical protein
VITLAVAVALALPQQGPSLPRRGVLVPGRSLAGVRLGETQAQVIGRWGRRYELCTVCTRQTWLYTYPHGEPLGAGVSFKAGRVSAVFTLGSPTGWRTAEGLLIGELVPRAQELYGRLRWHVCIGYGALSIHTRTAVTSIYTTGEAVYGFALTHPSEPVCQ